MHKRCGRSDPTTKSTTPLASHRAVQYPLRAEVLFFPNTTGCRHARSADWPCLFVRLVFLSVVSAVDSNGLVFLPKFRLPSLEPGAGTNSQNTGDLINV